MYRIFVCYNTTGIDVKRGLIGFILKEIFKEISSLLLDTIITFYTISLYIFLSVKYFTITSSKILYLYTENPDTEISSKYQIALYNFLQHNPSYNNYRANAQY